MNEFCMTPSTFLFMFLSFRGDKAVARSPSSRIEKIINKAPFITTHSFQHYNDIRLSDKWLMQLYSAINHVFLLLGMISNFGLGIWELTIQYCKETEYVRSHDRSYCNFWSPSENTVQDAHNPSFIISGEPQPAYCHPPPTMHAWMQRHF